jgi:16S rRNA processing protein RimM
VAEPARLEVGRIGRAHGLRGEVGVKLVTDRLARLAVGSVLFADDRTLVVASSRRQGERWIVRFEGVDDRPAAEALNGRALQGDPLPAADGELWVHELIGAAVHDPAGRELGRVVAVEANPASDLLVLEDDTLIPMTFVVERTGDVVVVDVPEGLLEVNRREPS